MGVRAMPSQVPSLSDDPSVEANLRAWEVFSKWDKPFLCAYTDNDPVSSGRDAEFRSRVPGAQGQPHQIISGGGHFLQEGRGDVLAQILIDFIEANPMARAG
jgi:haloalkane dehalogenase